MSWIVNILKSIFGGEEDETSGRRDHRPSSVNHMNSVNSRSNYTSSVQGSLQKPQQVQKAPYSFTASSHPSSSATGLDLDPPNTSNKTKYGVASNYAIPERNKESINNPRPFVHHMNSVDSGINYKSSVQESLEKTFQDPKLPKSCASSSPPSSSNKTKYVVVDKDIASNYSIPEDIKELIKKDIVPEVLKKPLSPSTYRDYFAALLYAEDFYVEKWNNFCLSDVNLEVHKAAIYKKSNRNKNLIESDESDDKVYVAFKIDLIPERRPFLLSRDFVFVQPSDKKVEPFQGILYRVVQSNLVLAEFGDDFHRQHLPNRKYDVSFSFNRVCLKRCHQAVVATVAPLFRNFLFPDRVPAFENFNQDQNSAIQQMSRLTGPPPYLIEGSLCLSYGEQLSRTGMIIQATVLKIYRTSPNCRILVTAPTNRTCDVLLRSLKNVIPESDMFRANAAFRELDGVPYDILPSCEHKGEYFTCPSLEELRSFKVILSTFVSSFRLHSEGICAGHFSHIFLVDASSATEPEAMVALANLVDNKTSVVLTGAPGNTSGWIRSDIARGKGLKKSYFQRLLEIRNGPN